MQVAITVDLEHDCPPHLDTYRGVTEGMPPLLDLLQRLDVRATFFSTGDVARRYPETVRRIVTSGHELGCHGDTHARLGTLSPAGARHEITAATATLRSFGPVTSFRAPNFDFPASFMPLLRDAGYTHDSSFGRHKPATFFVAPHTIDGVRRIGATTAPSVVRLPRSLRNMCYSRFRNPVVLFFHPWEFVDFTRAPLPVDCKYRTGEPALVSLEETIDYFRSRRADFRRFAELEV